MMIFLFSDQLGKPAKIPQDTYMHQIHFVVFQLYLINMYKIYLHINILLKIMMMIN